MGKTEETEVKIEDERTVILFLGCSDKFWEYSC